jgi:stearoyl-CoA desaturase (delta-9 desaturase)
LGGSPVPSYHRRDREALLRTYNTVGYALLFLHGLVSALLAPPALGLGGGLAVGGLYLLFIWLLVGLYLPEILHMGIAHRALEFKGWFVKSTTLLCNTIGIYVDPRSWVNRHRHHHAFSDRDGDPNKLDADGFWKTLYLCLFPYRCQFDLARDPIFETWPMRLASSSFFAAASQLSSYVFVWWLVTDWIYAFGLWCSVRLVALWANMVQNYWTHDRRFGARRYQDDDNAMNIGDWLPVTATFSACLQNNHHHHPQFLRLSHSPTEYDFGFQVLRLMKRLGLVTPSHSGGRLPVGLELEEVGL